MAFQRGVQQVELVTARDRSALNCSWSLSSRRATSARAVCPAICTRRASSRTGASRSTTTRSSRTRRSTVASATSARARADAADARAAEPVDALLRASPRGRALRLPGVRGTDLVDDYLRAKGDESYGGIDNAILRRPWRHPAEAGAAQAAALFDAPEIEEERWPSARRWATRRSRAEPDLGGRLRSVQARRAAGAAVLRAARDRPAQAGEADRGLRVSRGRLGADDLPDLSDIFPDDPRVRARIGLQTEPDATPAEPLIQACGSCHNDVLDQTISRARFNIDLARLDRAELDLAIERIELRPTAGAPCHHPTRGSSIARTRAAAHLPARNRAFGRRRRHARPRGESGDDGWRAALKCRRRGSSRTPVAQLALSRAS